MVDRQKMQAQLILHEGLKLRPYQDTLNIWTVLVGYNIDARGWDFIEHVTKRKLAHLPLTSITFTREEALAVLAADIDRVESAVRRLLPKFDSLNEVRQRVCVDLAFNMALKALNFKKAIDAINREQWSVAARELYASKWATQVDDGPGGRFGRADRLAGMLLTGNDYTH